MPLHKAVSLNVTYTENLKYDRSKDTVYQNTSGHLMAVTMIIRATTPAGTDMALGFLSIGPTTACQYDPSCGGFRDAVGNGYFTLFALIPRKWYFKLRTALAGGGTIEVMDWFENLLFP